MPLRPWQAQQMFGANAAEVKAPEAVSVVHKAKTAVVISWSRRVGTEEGFVVLLGESSNNLNVYETIFRGDKMNYSVEISGLTAGKEYFVTVVAFRGDKRSEMVQLWKVIPNYAGRVRPAELVPVVPQEVSALAQSNLVLPDPEPNSDAASQSVAPQSAERRPAAICSACSGDVFLDNADQVFKCSGCNAVYVQRVIDGKFLPVRALTNGICSCCRPKRPLIQPPEGSRLCSQTGEQYVELPGNGMVRISCLDYGLCSCCNPVVPLVLNVQGQIVCSCKRENLYVREGNGFVLRIPEAPPSLLSDIDAALAAGSAEMLPGGILTAGQSRRRRR
jgi:hypothetical protein